MNRAGDSACINLSHKMAGQSERQEECQDCAERGYRFGRWLLFHMPLRKLEDGAGKFIGRLQSVRPLVICDGDSVSTIAAVWQPIGGEDVGLLLRNAQVSNHFLPHGGFSQREAQVFTRENTG